MTLAYQFDVRQKEALKSLIKSTLNVPKSCSWELNLYSRDVAAVNKQVTIYFLIIQYYFILIKIILLENYLGL